MIDEYLDKIDSLIEGSMNLPFTGGKCMVDVDKLHDLVDSVRLNIPQEMKQAKAIVADRREIIEDAQAEAEAIIKNAERKARAMLEQEEIVKAATERANTLLSEATRKSREMEAAALNLTEQVLKECEEALAAAHTEIRSKRSAITKKK